MPKNYLKKIHTNPEKLTEQSFSLLGSQDLLKLIMAPKTKICRARFL